MYLLLLKLEILCLMVSNAVAGAVGTGISDGIFMLCHMFISVLFLQLKICTSQVYAFHYCYG